MLFVVDRKLLARLVQGSAHQPATCLFRAIEIGHVLQSGWLPRTGRLLDVGCGDGFILQILQEGLDADWRAVGVDPDAEEVSLAAARGIYEKTIATSAAEISEASASFDIALSNSVLEHVGAIDQVLREVGRLLRPGGAFVFTVPSEFFPSLLGGPGFLGWIATGTRQPKRYRHAIDERVLHLRYWSVDQWREALTASGLRLRRSSYYMTGEELRRWEALSNATGGLAARIAGRGARPIDIQRRLGMRRLAVPAWLRVLSLAACRVFCVGLGPREQQQGLEAPAVQGACLLIEAVRA